MQAAKQVFNVLKVQPGHALSQTWSTPVSVNLLINLACNSKCETCDSWKMKEGNEKLSLQDYEKLASEVKALGIPLVTIGGGEPTLRADFLDIISALRSQGRSVQMTTNALNLSESKRQALYESGIERITVSFDSHIPEIYENIRGVNGVEKVIQNLALLLKEKPKHLQIDTNSVLCSQNASSFVETLDFLRDLGVPKLQFSAVSTTEKHYLTQDPKYYLREIDKDTLDQCVKGLIERKKNTPSLIGPSMAFVSGMKTYFDQPEKIVYPCYAGYLAFDIYYDGEVYLCGNLPKIGSLKENSLQQIWFSKKAQDLRNDMVKGRCPNCYFSCKIEPSLAANYKYLPSFSLEKLRSS